MIRFFTFLGFVFGLASVALAEPTQVPFKDEAAQDPSFVEYRAQLMEAIEARNTEAVIALSDTEIHLSFGGHAGHDDFREMLNVPEENLSDEYKPQAQAMRDEIWGGLKETMDLGGTFDADGTFSAPYYWSADIPDTFDPFSTYFVTGSRVALRDGPSERSNVLARVSYAVVTIPYTDEARASDWSLITIPGTKLSGYMHNDFLRSQVGYRAGFSKETGEWKMTFFIAGD